MCTSGGTAQMQRAWTSGGRVVCDVGEVDFLLAILQQSSCDHFEPILWWNSFARYEVSFNTRLSCVETHNEVDWRSLLYGILILHIGAFIFTSNGICAPER